MTAVERARGYFIAATNARQALAGTLSVSPLRFLVFAPLRRRRRWRPLRTRHRSHLSSWPSASCLLSPLARTLFDQAEAFGASQRFGPERVEPGRQFQNDLGIFENLAGQRRFNIRR